MKDRARPTKAEGSWGKAWKKLSTKFQWCCPSLILQDDMGNVIYQGNTLETQCSVFALGVDILGSLTLTGTYQNFRLPEGKQMVTIKTHILFIEAGMCHSVG